MAAPIRSIAVAGSGAVAWLAAVSFARRVPGVAVTVVEPAGSAPSIEDCTAGTWPHFGATLAGLGIDARHLAAKAGGVLRLGQHVRGWSARDHSECFGAHGAAIDGVPFHQLWARAAAAGSVAPFQDYSTAAMLARAGRYAEPVRGVPGFEAGFGFDSMLLRDALRAMARALGVRQLSGEMEVASEGERLTHLRVGGAAVAADLYVDATGADARLLSALPGGDAIQSWSGWLPIDRALVADAPPDPEPPVVDLAEAHGTGWRLIAPLRSRTIALHLYASGFTSAEAERAAFGVPEARLIAFAQGRRACGWIGNCVAVGDAAASLEPLGAPGLRLAAMTIERIVASLPDTDFAEVELAEYNRRWAIDAELVRDAVIARYATSRRNEPFWRATSAVEPPPELAHALALFRERGVLPARDGDPMRLDDWLGLLIGNGVVPERASAAADAVAPERFAEASARVRAAIDEVVARAPRHRAWLEGWLRD